MDPSSFGALPESEASPETETTEEQLSLVADFLKDIPEQDRSIVEKHVKNWDAGVTKRFQSIHDSYKTKLEPWEKLGAEPDMVAAALETIKLMETHPDRAYLALQEILQSSYPEMWSAISENGQMNQEPEYEQQPEEYADDLPPAVQAQLDALRQQVEQLSQFNESQTQEAAEAQQMAQFDAMLEKLHTSHGEFDNDWVTLQIARGATPEQAVQAYQEFEKNIRGNSQNNRPVPPIIGGQGGIPSDQVDASKVRGAERRALVEQILAAKEQQG